VQSLRAFLRRAGRRGTRTPAAFVAKTAAAAALVAGVASGALPGAHLPAAAASGLSINQTWSVVLPDQGNAIVFSSPNLATLSNGPDVVVGDRGGHLWALNLSNGSGVPGWPYNTPNPIDSSPSVARAPGSNLDEVFTGLGQVGVSSAGGYQAVNPDGSSRWWVGTPGNFPVTSGMAVGYLQGDADVVGSSLSQEEYAMDANSGAVLNGFPWFQADSSFSTPALADLYGDGRTEIIEGGDSTAGNAYGVQYQNGGHLRILSPTGNAGTGAPAGGLICQYNTDQNVMSSPAVGNFLAGGGTGITFGTGTFYGGASTTDDIMAVDANCNLVWSTKLDGYTSSSPALADVLGNGGLQVVEGTNNGSGGGSVWVLNGNNGAPVWHTAAAGMVIGSVVTADLTGGGYQDVIVPTTAGVQVFDGKSGALVTTLGSGMAFQNSPLVTDDPNGTIGITVAGYNGTNNGEVVHYEVAGSNGNTVNEVGAWPQFHHDPALSGNANPSSGPPGSVEQFVADHLNGHVWNAYNETVNANGPTITGGSSVLNDPRDGLLHDYVRADNGDLVEYVDNDVGGQLWNAYDLSFGSGNGGTIGNDPDVIYDPADGLIHIYVQASNGDLTEYVDDNANGHPWNAYDLSYGASGGTQIAGTPSAFYDPADGLIHVYVRDVYNHLVEYDNGHVYGAPWNEWALSVGASGGGPVTGTPSAFYLPVDGLIHIYVPGPGGDLVEYDNGHVYGAPWNAWDLSYGATGGQPITGTPSPFYDPADGLIHVYAETPGGYLVEYDNGHYDGVPWNCWGLSVGATGGSPVASSPSALLDPSDGLIHVYVRASSGHMTEYVNGHYDGVPWNAWDLTGGSGGPPVIGDPTALVVGGMLHVFDASG